MTQQSKDLQPCLFEEPRMELRPAQRAQVVATVVEALLREISAALVAAKRRENDHEQNHG